MRRLVLSCLLLAGFMLIPLRAEARQRFTGICITGNETINANRRVHNASCTVRVFDSGTANLSTIFSDNVGSILANPFTAGTDGFYFFYADDGRYDVQMSAGTPAISSAKTIGDVLLSDGVFGTILVVSFSATPTFDASLADIFDITLTGNVTSSTISNAVSGKFITFIIRQDGTGGWTFAWPGDSVQRLSTVNLVASSVTVVSYVYDGTNWEEMDTSGLSLTLANLNGIRFPDGRQFVTIADAVDDCPTTGCTIMDFRTGTITLSADPFVGHNFPITLITGGATYEITTTGGTLDFCFDTPSDFAWVGNNTTIQADVDAPSGCSATRFGFFTARTTDTTGNMGAASNSLLLASDTNADVGDLVGVVAAAAEFPEQATQLNGVHNDSTTTLTVDDAPDSNGWGDRTNYLLIDNSEIVSCTGVSGFTFAVCTRGAFGSIAAAYAGGEPVEALGYLHSEIIAKSGLTVTLADVSARAVTGAPVKIGSQNITLRGNLTINGRQDPNAANPAVNVAGFFGELVRNFKSGDMVVFTRLDHVGIQVNSGRDSHFGGSFSCIGRVSDSAGFDILVFGQGSNNNFSTVNHKDCDLNGDGTIDSGNTAIAMDDRSGDFILTDGAPTNNGGYVGPIRGYPVTGVGIGIFINGGSNNSIYASYIGAGSNSISIGDAGQWIANGSTASFPPLNNVVFAGHTVAAVTIPAGTNNFVLVGRSVASTHNITAGNTAIIGNNTASVMRFYGDIWQVRDAVNDEVCRVWRSGTVNEWSICVSATTDHLDIKAATGDIMMRFSNDGGQLDFNVAQTAAGDIRFRSENQSGCFFIDSNLDRITLTGCSFAAGTSVDLNVSQSATGDIRLRSQNQSACFLIDSNLDAITLTGCSLSGNSGMVLTGGVLEYTDAPELAASTTPSVTGGNLFLTNSTASITDFTGEQNGQLIILLCGADTTTSLVDSSPLFLAGAFTCSAGDSITLVSDGTVWTEISRSVN